MAHAAFSLALDDMDMRPVDQTAASREPDLPLAETVVGIHARSPAARLGERDCSAVDAAD